MNYRHTLAVIAIVSALGLMTLSHADTLDITDESFAPAEPQMETLVVPGRGMSMDQVRQEFGEPNNILPAVGDPPITRWEYNDFVVHFEHSFVIHTVVSTIIPR